MEAISPIAVESPTGSVKATNNRHLNYVDGLRALVALAVSFGHFSQMIFPNNGANPYMRLTEYLVCWINPVPTFIVISGFCLMLPVVWRNGVLSGGAKIFFWKRAKRILPPYYITLGLCAILIVTLLDHKTGYAWDAAIPISGRGVLTHLLLIQQLSGLTIYQFDPPMWSIGVEWWIYFLFPLLVFSWARLGVVRTLVVAAIVSVAIWWPIKTSHWAGLSPLLSLLFVFGMAAATIAFSTDRTYVDLRKSSIFGVLSYTMFIPIWLLALFGHGGALQYFIATMCSGIWSVSVLVSALNPTTLLHKILSTPLMVKIGLFSYTLYLIHFPLGELLYYDVVRPEHLSSGLQFLSMWTGGVGIVIIAFILYHVIEKPFLNSKVTA